MRILVCHAQISTNWIPRFLANLRNCSEYLAQHLKVKINRLPSRELRYPTLGKGKSSTQKFLWCQKDPKSIHLAERDPDFGHFVFCLLGSKKRLNGEASCVRFQLQNASSRRATRIHNEKCKKTCPSCDVDFLLLLFSAVLLNFWKGVGTAWNSSELAKSGAPFPALRARPLRTVLLTFQPAQLADAACFCYTNRFKKKKWTMSLAAHVG